MFHLEFNFLEARPADPRPCGKKESTPWECLRMAMCLCMCVHACMHACMHVCMYVCMYVYIHMYVCIGRRIRICIYACLCEGHNVNRHIHIPKEAWDNHWTAGFICPSGWLQVRGYSRVLAVMHACYCLGQAHKASRTEKANRGIRYR